MSFLARLGTDLITVEAGATTPAVIEIINRGEEGDQYELSIEGLDPEWTAIPVPVVTINARESQEEKLFFKPPRVSESSAGNYPFVVKVRSLTSGEARTAQGVIAVKPYNHLSIELAPKKGFVSPLRKFNTFEATLMNLGNTEHTVQLFGSDPDDDCAFEFDQEQVPLGPGQQRSVPVTVSPTNQNLFSGNRLYGFSVTGRSIEQPSVVGVAQAQLEQKPLISLGTMAVAVIVFLVIGLWIYLIPKPPTCDLSVDRTEITKGESLTVTWHVSGDPNLIHLTALNQTIYDGPPAPGSATFMPIFSGDFSGSNFTIDGYLEKDGKRYDLHRPLSITVKPPEVIPDPVITKFSIDQRTLAIDQPVTVTYKTENADKVMLLPMGTQLDPTVDQMQFTPNDLNMKQLILVATNSKSGKQVRKEIRITVIQASKAKIIAFDANPKSVPYPAGDVQVTWQVLSAVRIELKVGDGPVQKIDDATGSQTVHFDKSGILTLTAYDDAGVATKSTVKVEVQPAPPPPTTGDTNTQSITTTGG